MQERYDSLDDWVNTTGNAFLALSLGCARCHDHKADPITQAEGYRYLSRLLRAGLEAFLEFADPRAPVLRRMVHETVKMGSDNPGGYRHVYL